MLEPPGTWIMNLVFGCISFPYVVPLYAQDGALVEFASSSDYVQLDRILAPDQPKSEGLFRKQRWIL